MRSQFKGDKKLYFTPITSNDFNFNIIFSKKEINISYHDYVYHAQKKITSSKEGGKILELPSWKTKEYLREGDIFSDGIFQYHLTIILDDATVLKMKKVTISLRL